MSWKCHRCAHGLRIPDVACAFHARWLSHWHGRWDLRREACLAERHFDKRHPTACVLWHVRVWTSLKQCLAGKRDLPSTSQLAPHEFFRAAFLNTTVCSWTVPLGPPRPRTTCAQSPNDSDITSAEPSVLNALLTLDHTATPVISLPLEISFQYSFITLGRPRAKGKAKRPLIPPIPVRELQQRYYRPPTSSWRESIRLSSSPPPTSRVMQRLHRARL